MFMWGFNKFEEDAAHIYSKSRNRQSFTHSLAGVNKNKQRRVSGYTPEKGFICFG